MSQVQVIKGVDHGIYLIGGQAEDSEQYTSQMLYFE
jgi:hypothetical protein